MPNAHETVDYKIRHLRNRTLTVFLERVDETIVDYAVVAHDRFSGFMSAMSSITTSIRLDGVHQPLVPNVDTFCDLVGAG